MIEPSSLLAGQHPQHLTHVVLRKANAFRSHVFCINCSDSLGLSSSAGLTRICPACSTQLNNPDDVVVTQLNPTEDYKTSVLSGLSPSIIMECATRGLAFYSYQTSQEMWMPLKYFLCQADTSQSLPRVLGEESHGKILTYEPADGQAYP